MRSVYIESWARVRTLSLSGRILRYLGGRVLVQGRGLGGKEEPTVDLTTAATRTTPTQTQEEQQEVVDVQRQKERGGEGKKASGLLPLPLPLPLSLSLFVPAPSKLEYVGPVVT